MMNKLFFITLLCFISCQPSDEDLKINVSNTIRVSVSGLNINKVPVNGRTAAIPKNQQKITFIRKHTLDSDTYNDIAHISFQPIPESTFEVTLQLPYNEFNDINWINDTILVFSNLNQVIEPYGGDPPYIDPIGDYHTPIFYSEIQLQNGITTYDLEMSPMYYELIIKSPIDTTIGYIDVILEIDYNIQTSYNSVNDFSLYEIGGPPDNITLQLTDQENSVFESELLINFYGYFKVTDIHYYDRNSALLQSITPNVHFDTDRGKRYTLSIPSYTTTFGKGFRIATTLEIKQEQIN